MHCTFKVALKAIFNWSSASLVKMRWKDFLKMEVWKESLRIKLPPVSFTHDRISSSPTYASPSMLKLQIPPDQGILQKYRLNVHFWQPAPPTIHKISMLFCSVLRCLFPNRYDFAASPSTLRQQQCQDPRCMDHRRITWFWRQCWEKSSKRRKQESGTPENLPQAELQQSTVQPQCIVEAACRDRLPKDLLVVAPECSSKKIHIHALASEILMI